MSGGLCRLEYAIAGEDMSFFEKIRCLVFIETSV